MAGHSIAHIEARAAIAAVARNNPVAAARSLVGDTAVRSLVAVVEVDTAPVDSTALAVVADSSPFPLFVHRGSTLF